MVDWFLILAPVLLVPIVGLLRFAGCQLVFPLRSTDAVESSAVNCGGPSLDDAGVTFESDDTQAGTEGTSFKSEGGQPVKLTTAVVTDGNGVPASELYATARTGDDLKFTFLPLVPGGYVATLKFAEILEAQGVGERVLEVRVNGESSGTYDIVAQAGGRLITHDEDFLARAVDSKITVELIGVRGAASVNAIQLGKRDSVAILPSRVITFAGASLTFQAATNFDNATFAWALLPTSPPGQLIANGASSAYTAPNGIPAPLQQTITLVATAGSSVAQTIASLSIYPPIDTLTRGAWVNRYGLDGHALANTPPDSRLPLYVAQFDVRLSDGAPLNVANLGIPADDPRVLVDPNGNPRAALVWNDLNGTHGITLSFTLLDSDPHLFGVYCLDNGPDRRQRFTVTQLDSGITETVDSAIGTGTYLFWIGKGRIQVEVTKAPGSAGVNNVVSAVFFR